MAKYIPTCEEDESQFTGAVSYRRGEKGRSALAPDSTARARQLEVQRADAQRRNVVWNAESRTLTDSDAIGEVDPDYADDSGISLPTLLGLRKEDGCIEPMEAEDVEMTSAQEGAQYFGAAEEVPSHVGKLVSAHITSYFDRFKPDIVRCIMGTITLT